MKRDFSSESNLNILLRIIRALSGRCRGYLYSILGMFSPDTSRKLYFGTSPRFMNSRGIHLESHVHFGVMARIECYQSKRLDPLIHIGSGTSFGDYAHIGAIEGILVGKNVLGGSHILIIDHSHGDPGHDMRTRNTVPPRKRPLSTKGQIRIDDNVWIGDNAVILGGTHIGEGAIIAANTVVSGTVKPYTIFFDNRG